MKKIFTFLVLLTFLAIPSHAQLNYHQGDVNGDGAVDISDVVSLVNLILNGGTTLTCPDNNHPHAVDLGLPSGTKWACCNVDAPTPEGYGGYFAWGETDVKLVYDWSTYTLCNGTESSCQDIGANIGKTKYDVAQEKWGGFWRMPSSAQFQELLDNCSSEWTMVNGVYGRKFIGKNGCSIFFPSAGFHEGTNLSLSMDYGIYWSDTKDSDDNSCAKNFQFSASTTYLKNNPRYAGFPVRPIGTSVAKTLGLSDIVHVIGYGQSLMAGSSSGDVVTTSQSRSNLYRFAGGVRPYDVFDLDIGSSTTNKRVHITRKPNVNPIYLEMSDNKDDCLISDDVARINTSVGELIPLTEQRVKYTSNGDGTYSPSGTSSGVISGHGDGETPLSGFCEGLLNSLEKTYGGNFGFDILATCCAYGSADFLSLLPLDRDGRIHNYEDSPKSDGSNMNYFELVMMSVKAAKELADAENKSYSVDVVVFMESNTIAKNSEGGTVSITIPIMAYRIAQLFTLINQRIKAITKQRNDIFFLCDQSKTYTRQREALRILGVENEIVLKTAEQNILKSLPNYDVEPYDLSKIFLVTSANNYKIGRDGGDRIHHPSFAQKQKGATLGDAYAKILTGKGFEPLHPLNVKVIGNEIFIKYHVPVSPIVIDATAVNGNQACPNYMDGCGVNGFGISDGTNYYDIITSVEVSEPDTIKITCSESPIGKNLEYCYKPISDGGTGLPTNCEFGNIRDSQGDVSKIKIGNTDYPLHNWSIGFSKAL